MCPLASDCSLCLNQVHPSSPTCLSLGVMVTSGITLETGLPRVHSRFFRTGQKWMNVLTAVTQEALKPWDGIAWLSGETGERGQTSSSFLYRSLCAKFPFHVRKFEWSKQKNTSVWHRQCEGLVTCWSPACDSTLGVHTLSLPPHPLGDRLQDAPGPSQDWQTVNDPPHVEQPGSGLDFSFLWEPQLVLCLKTPRKDNQAW